MVKTQKEIDKRELVEALILNKKNKEIKRK